MLVIERVRFVTAVMLMMVASSYIGCLAAVLTIDYVGKWL